jgi:hypothetical protein
VQEILATGVVDYCAATVAYMGQALAAADTTR